MTAPLLAIVPARGGSVGVPRKNLRPIAGRPLIGYTLAAAVEAQVFDRIVVSTDDAEIWGWATAQGYEVLERPGELAGPQTTIAEVAAHVADSLSWEGAVAVLQPTSPLRSAAAIKAAVDRYREAGVTSLSSVVREPHLYWYDEGDDLASARPLFAERVNRQFARHRVLRENGAIQMVTAEHVVGTRTMVADDHLLFELPAEESADVDTIDDLQGVRRRLEQGSVVFRLRANRVVGSGHLFHCLRLAEELSDQALSFLLLDCDPFVHEMLAARGYDVRDETDLVEDLRRLRRPGPNLIVNDVLDTDEADVLAERAAGYLVVNIEDLGPGARFADWVVNALYPLRLDDGSHTANGPRFATLRNEFLDLPPKQVRPVPERVLVTFGGTDPAGLGERLARALAGALPAIEVVLVLGPGADDADPPGVQVKRQIGSMAAEMAVADVVLTSAGRTVYEAAATGTPVVVVAQNAREATHSHLGYDRGVVFLGLGPLLPETIVVEAVQRLLDDHPLRAELSDRLRLSIDHLGAERIATRIRSLMRGL